MSGYEAGTEGRWLRPNNNGIGFISSVSLLFYKKQKMCSVTLTFVIFHDYYINPEHIHAKIHNRLLVLLVIS